MKFQEVYQDGNLGENLKIKEIQDAPAPAPALKAEPAKSTKTTGWHSFSNMMKKGVKTVGSAAKVILGQAYSLVKSGITGAASYMANQYKKAWTDSPTYTEAAVKTASSIAYPAAVMYFGPASIVQRTAMAALAGKVGLTTENAKGVSNVGSKMADAFLNTGQAGMTAAYDYFCKSSEAVSKSQPAPALQQPVVSRALALRA
jgi:hypothetical protein